MSIVRTRFAPSPTGFLHVGGVRTALFAWLVAQQVGGQFILRIEDTDRARFVPGADQHIIDCLTWLGLNFDEGPIYQSQRVKDGVYKKWAEKLIEKGRAYADPRTPEELNKLREDAKTKKKPFLIRNYPLKTPPKWNGSQPLRFKSNPKNGFWDDEVMNVIKYQEESIDDFILIKSDGYPTYNFAHIIDDLEMGITHIIRGQEFLSSLPNYLDLYEALGQKSPIFATVPHIMNEQGNKKLSKRDGAKDILDYKKEGFLAEAMINFLASLGWNDGTEQEIFSREELIEKFSLDRVQKSGARFDERRLEWMNGVYIRQLPLEELYEKAKDFWPPEAKNYDDKYKRQVLALVQERMKYFAELPELSLFFFKDVPIDKSLIENHKQLKKMPVEDIKTLLNTAKLELADSNFSLEDLTARLNGLLGLTHTKPVLLFSLIRIATTQAPASPSLADTLAVIGKDKSLARIDATLAAL